LAVEEENRGVKCIRYHYNEECASQTVSLNVGVFYFI
jgi:hypothetical protein